MSDKLKCDYCGMPSEVAERMGMKLELQQDGRVLCPVCRDVIPEMSKDLAKVTMKRSKDFSVFISSSACMFSLDPVSVASSTASVFLFALDQISDSDMELAVKIIMEHSLYLDKKLNEIEKKYEEMKNADERPTEEKSN